jgi:hypothetical protein
MWYTEGEDCVQTSENFSFALRGVQEDEENKHRTQVQSKDFKQKVVDPTCGLGLFGTVPPPQKLPIEQMESIASSIADSIKSLRTDALMIYDIQDERSRDGTDRPFPFFKTHEPRRYAQLLERFASCETIVYRAMESGESREQFNDWLAQTQTFGVKHMVIVGGSARPSNSFLKIRYYAHCSLLQMKAFCRCLMLQSTSLRTLQTCFWVELSFQKDTGM